MLEHEPLGRCHRRFRLVLVRALRQGQESGNTLDNLLVGRRGRRIRYPRRTGVHSESCASLPKRRTVRSLLGLAERLVNVLMGHLVLQNFDHGRPGLLKHEGPRDLDGTGPGQPPAERRTPCDELEGRGPKPPAKEDVVQLRVCRAELADEQSFKFCGELRASIHTVQ